MQTEEIKKKWQEKNVEKHILQSELCNLEFELKGFKEELSSLNIPYHLIRVTPLGKNPYCFGIKRGTFQDLKQGEILLIVGVMNKFKVDEHIFYVYQIDKDTFNGFKSGYDGSFEYMTYCFSCGGEKRYLPTLEEFLEERKKEVKNEKQSTI